MEKPLIMGFTSRSADARRESEEKRGRSGALAELVYLFIQIIEGA